MPNIVITGASSGLGGALARIYAAPGNTLFLVARRKDRLEEIGTEVRHKGSVPLLYPADVQDGNRMEEIAREIISLTGSPDLIVANAGVRGESTGHGSENMEQLFRTNVLGVLHTVLPFLPVLRKSGKGHIAIIGSLAGYRGLTDAGDYCASKAALSAWTDSLRLEMEPHGVCVTLVNPGFIHTEMTQDNPYPMPFVLSSARAAEKIRKGLEREKALVEFPFPLALMIRILAALPPRTGDGLLRFFSRSHEGNRPIP